jgi:hypothetical protein
LDFIELETEGRANVEGGYAFFRLTVDANINLIRLITELQPLILPPHQLPPAII